jgi:ADP-ribose pyrophosphatase YjhB (NUDIX family)
MIPAEEYYKSLPKKRMASGILFFDEIGNILLVKPSYKNYWSIPGGVIEENESPRLAAEREVREEINLSVTLNRLLCVDYIEDREKGENIQFVFYGGTLSQEDILKIKLQSDELEAYQFIDPGDAVPLLGVRLAKRFPACLSALKNNTVLYLENGRVI